MLTKRRLVVQPVDGACFSGRGSLVVSFRNGADHVRPTPVPLEAPPEPLDSRIMAHSTGGAQSVDGYLRERDEYVLAAGVSTDGVVACRVGSLPPRHPLASGGSAARTESAERILFFSGRHRLSEMTITSVDTASLCNGGNSPVPATAMHLRFPTLCLRSPQGLHLAVFAHAHDTLAACATHGYDGGIAISPGCPGANPTRQGGWAESSTSAYRVAAPRDRERRLQFAQRRIACISGGCSGISSGSHDEVTVLFTDHTVAICGFPCSVDGVARDVGDNLGGDGFPSFGVLLDFTLPPDQVPTGVSPIRVVWAGHRTLWIVYADGSLRAVRVALPPSQRSAAGYRGHRNSREEGGEGSAEAARSGDRLFAEVLAVFSGSLLKERGTVAELRLHVHADTRSSALHYCFSRSHSGDANVAGESGDDDTAAKLYYGTAYLRASLSNAKKHPAEASTAIISLQQSSLLFGECLYGIRYDGGRYHVLTQSDASKSPLFITHLPRFVVQAQEASHAATAPEPLSLRIVREPESRLGAIAHRVEAAIRAVNSNRNMGPLRSAAGVASAVVELRELRHCVHALLCREQQQLVREQRREEDMYVDASGQGGDGWRYPRATTARQSYPQQLLQLLSRKQGEVSVFGLLAELNCLDDAVDHPLHESLNLHEARAAAGEAQSLLKQYITSTTFPSSIEVDSVHTKLWPTQVTLCVDAILSDLGFSAAHSLSQILAEVPAVHGGFSPVMALLVLYYSHRRSLIAADAMHAKEVATENVVHVPSLTEQRRAEAARCEFLAQCNLPATSLSTWAFASWAVDHGVNPCARLEGHAAAQRLEEEKQHARGEEWGHRAGREEEEERRFTVDRIPPAEGEEPYQYLLGPAVDHLDTPPLLALLPALLNGLLHTLAMDTAYRLLPTALALYAAGEPLPPALGLKLLFIALQAKAYSTVESIFVQSRGTALEVVATQALALVVARTGDVRAIRGLLRIGGPHEKIVEATLASDQDLAHRERTLLRFYTLMQRYADALAVCEAMGARDGLDGQRASTVASHLRSLMPHGNTTYLLSAGARGGSNGKTSNERGSPVPPPLAQSPPPAMARVCGEGGCAVGTGRLGLAGVCPTPLEGSRAERAAELRRASRRFAPAGGNGTASASAGAGAAFYGGPSRMSPFGTATAMRPSSILNSLDRPSSDARAASQARTPLRPSNGANEEGDLSPTTAATTEPAGVNPRAGGGRGPTASHWSALEGEGAVPTCEAVLQRSGNVCGRPRPCPYHDRR